MRSELENLLEGWAMQNGIADIACDERGEYALLFDGDYEVRLSQVSRTILLTADLGALSSEQPVAAGVLDELMSLQLADSRDAAEVIALDGDNDHLVLFRILPADRSNAEAFSRALSAFVNGLEFWTRQLKALRAPALSPFTPMTVVHA